MKKTELKQLIKEQITLMGYVDLGGIGHPISNKPIVKEAKTKEQKEDLDGAYEDISSGLSSLIKDAQDIKKMVDGKRIKEKELKKLEIALEQIGEILGKF